MGPGMCYSALWKQSVSRRGDSSWAIGAGCAAVLRSRGSGPRLSLHSQRQEGQGWGCARGQRLPWSGRRPLSPGSGAADRKSVV